MIDLRYVKKLIEMIDESTVDSVEITSDKGMKIRISKSPQQRGMQMAAPMPMQTMVQAPMAAHVTPAHGVPALPEGGGEPAAPAEAPKPAGLEVKSPMVGTYYQAAEPGAKPFVAVGDRVIKGQVICIIEAMKIMNEIESEHSGVVRAILAQDSQPVEYGQVLFKIDPNG